MQAHVTIFFLYAVTMRVLYGKDYIGKESAGMANEAAGISYALPLAVGAPMRGKELQSGRTRREKPISTSTIVDRRVALLATNEVQEDGRGGSNSEEWQWMEIRPELKYQPAGNEHDGKCKRLDPHERALRLGSRRVFWQCVHAAN